MKCPECQHEMPDSTTYCGNCGVKFHLEEEDHSPLTKTIQRSHEELAAGFMFAGRYQIVEELGRGGMGTIYKAHDTKLEEDIAIKLIKPEIAQDSKALKRFQHELKVARKISHKNIGRMYELMEDEGSHFITMEYIPGEDLRSLIKKTGKLSLSQSLSIAKQISAGLDEAHTQGIVHRDIKPGNVMIDSEGNARILDFGISRSMQADAITIQGIVMGTPEYMSPEQAEAEDIDSRSDIYSLGAVMYEMVTGQRLFAGDTFLSIAMKHKNEVPTPPKEINAEISEDLNQLILKCLAKQKEERYQSADQVLSDLTKVEEGIPTTQKKVLKKKPIFRKYSLPIFAFIILAIAAMLVWHPWTSKDIPPPFPEKPSIAVLPFEDLSSQKDQEYFCDGLTDELINRLTSIESLRIPGRTSSFFFKGKEYSSQEIGRKLNVEMFLEGSLRKSENRIRITVQLVNAADGYPLWSDKYERNVEDIFVLQDEISLAIVDKLQLNLQTEERANVVKRHTQNLKAYDLYFQGRYLWNKRSEPDLNRAIELFDQAIAEDPNYALAYTGIADCYSQLGWYDMLPPHEAYPKAKLAAKKALDLDDKLAEAHASLALIIDGYDWDWAACEAEYKQAIALNPNLASARHWYALFFSKMGRHEEAIAEAKKAKELDPLSLIVQAGLGGCYMNAKQHDRAIEEYERILEMNPEFLPARIWLGYVYANKGVYEKAIEESEKAVKLSGGNYPLARLLLSYSYAVSGKSHEALEILNDIVDQSGESYVSPFHIGLIFGVLDQRDKAFEWMEKGYAERDHWVGWIKVFPMETGWISDDRYFTLLKKLGLD